MKSSVKYDPNRQAFICGVCTKVHEVMAKTARDPEAMFEMKERLVKEHAGCGLAPYEQNYQANRRVPA